MSSKLVIRLVFAAVLAGFLAWLYQRIPGLNPGLAFIVVLLLGLTLGILGAKVILPRVGDAVSSFLFSMGGGSTAVGTDISEHSKAVAKLACGDYDGALAEYYQVLKQRPDGLYAIGEIAKIQANHLDDPEMAVSFLKSQLSERSWPMDGEAFILFRIADILRDVKHDKVRAHETLDQIATRFPKTRHSANARHRLEEWQHADAREELLLHRKLVEKNGQ